MANHHFAEQLMAMLRCVRDDCGASLSGPEAEEGGGGLSLGCTSCGARYRETAGFVDFAPEHPDSSSTSLGQGLMNSPAVAAIYETVLWRRSHTWLSGVGVKREMDQVLDWMAPLGSAPILDLGCGPGLYARRLARESPDALVVGVDLSEAMLRRAAYLARREGLENLKLVRADLCRLPFVDAGFARAHAAGVLHLLPGLETALGEIARALVDGGIFTAMTVRCGSGPVGWLQRRAARRGRGSFLTPQEYRASLERAGLSDFEWRTRRLMLLTRAMRTRRASGDGSQRAGGTVRE